MGKFVVFATSILLFLSQLIIVASAQDHIINDPKPFSVTVYNTESWPYAYLENDIIKGSAYKITKDVLNRANIPFEYKFQPWARVYQYGLTEKNYLIGSLGRTQKREKLFLWIGPVGKGVNINFYKKKSNPIQLHSLEEAMKYKIGVERNTYSHDFLVSKGFFQNNIRDASNIEQLWKKLEKGRFPLIIVAAHNYTKQPESELYEEVLFAFNVRNYLAISKATPVELVEKLQNAYKQLEKEGKILLK